VNRPLIVRSLRKSNLGWFLQTRTTVGEAAGRERAININKEVMAVWFGDLGTHQSEFLVHTSYLSGFGLPDRRPVEVVSDTRTIRLQGGRKNWRLAGDAVRGRYYDVRQGDLLFMDYAPYEQHLSWVVVRRGADGPCIPGEPDLYNALTHQLGDAKESMWTIEGAGAEAMREALVDFFPAVRDYFYLSETNQRPDLTRPEDPDSRSDHGRPSAYKDLSMAIGDPSPVSRRTGTSETTFQRSSLVRKAVLIRSGGRCENRECSGMPRDTTRSGQPILEVDHILDLGLGGPDHPENAIALCPNCHAMKTRGSRSDHWREEFLAIAKAAHSHALQQ